MRLGLPSRGPISSFGPRPLEVLLEISTCFSKLVEPSSATSRVLAAINSETLPQLRADFPGITWSFEGSQAEMRESTQALWGGFSLAMLIIYALLAIAFNNYVQPLIVMMSIPFGVVGAVIGHILLGYDLSLISLMGVIA